MDFTASHSQAISLRINDACAALGIGRTALYQLVADKKLRAIKIAGRTLIPRSELIRLTTDSGATIH